MSLDKGLEAPAKPGQPIHEHTAKAASLGILQEAPPIWPLPKR